MKTTKQTAKKPSKKRPAPGLALSAAIMSPPVQLPPADPWPTHASLASSRGGRPKGQLTIWRETYLVEFATWEARVRTDCFEKFVALPKGMKSQKSIAKFRYGQLEALRHYIEEAWFVLTDKWGVTMREFPPSEQPSQDMVWEEMKKNPYLRSNGLELLRRKGASALGKGYSLHEALLDWLGLGRSWMIDINRLAESWGVPLVARCSVF